MRRLIAGLLLACAFAAQAQAQRTVFVVRHAERADDSADTALSAKGEARARSLAALLRDAGIAAVYVTQYRRTAGTAQPLAEQQKISPVVIQAKDVPALVSSIRKDHAGDAVLVVGHSDTVPEILKALGCSEDVGIGHDEYDNLFIVVPRAPGSPPVLLRLRF